MQIRMDKLDAIPIRDWEEFLATARRVGATDTALVEEEVYPPDSDARWFKIDAQPVEGHRARPETIEVRAHVLHDLLYVTRAVARSDGNVCGLESVARKIMEEFNELFLERVLGPDPWAAAARKIAEEDAKNQVAL
jgi:hypothetical protein